MNCEHFPECGGCQFLDLTEDEETARKTSFVRDGFARAGLHFELADYLRAPLHSRRRATLTGKRTKKSVQVGFLSGGSHHIVDLKSCLVLRVGIFNLLPWMRAQIPQLASRTSMVKFHVTEIAHGFDVSIEGAKPLDAQTEANIAASCQEARIRRLQINGTQVFMDEMPFVVMEEVRVFLPPQPFLQASAEAESWLRALAQAPLHNCKTVADLFSGVGTLSFGMATEIHAYEGDKALTSAHHATINANQLTNTKAIERDLFRDPLKAIELERYDGVIIDPPRAGAETQCRILAQSNISIISYVSCDPVSFARDAKILEAGGYKISPVTLIDQFRFSRHIELFAQFEKSA